MDVRKVVMTLNDKGTSQSTAYWSWIIGLIIVFLGVGVMWILWVKLDIVHCPCTTKCKTKRKQSTQTVAGQPINIYDIELQVMRETHGAETSDPEQETLTPTAFVRHGVGVAEYS
jgi:hypothetical protein